MKILILTGGRSGSTSLFNALFNNLDSTLPVFEPTNFNSKCYVKDITKLNKYSKLMDKLNMKHLVEKHLIFNIFTGYYSDFFNNKFDSIDLLKVNPKPIIDFYLKYIKNFDKIILLVRNNTKELSESWYYASTTGTFFEKYKPISNIDSNKLNYYSVLSDKFNKTIKEISNKSKIPYVTYEDLFSGNKEFIKYFINTYQFKINNFENFYEHFNPKNRLRQV